MLEHIFNLILDSVGSLFKVVDIYNPNRQNEPFDTPACMVEFRQIQLENYLDKMQGTTMDIILHLYIDELNTYTGKSKDSNFQMLKLVDDTHKSLEGKRKTDVVVQNSPITRTGFNIGTKEGNVRHITSIYRTYVWDSSLSEEFGELTEYLVSEEVTIDKV